MENPLQNFLSRYKNLIPTSRVIKEVVVRVVGNECGISLEENQVDVRNSIVYLRIPPSARSMIYRKKNTLLERINAEGNAVVGDIR